LRKAIAAAPQSAALHHALGLSLVRSKRPQDALEELRQAVDIQPEQARYAYVYAVALHSTGRASDALRLLQDNAERHPADRDTLSALINFSRQAGNTANALKYARQLATLLAGNPELARIIRELEGTPGAGQRP
jgi:Flp pilus assembly protein TadD